MWSACTLQALPKPRVKRLVVKTTLVLHPHGSLMHPQPNTLQNHASAAPTPRETIRFCGSVVLVLAQWRVLAGHLPRSASAGSTAPSLPRRLGKVRVFCGTRTLLGAPGLTTSNKKLLGAPDIATRNKDATRGRRAP